MNGQLPADKPPRNLQTYQRHRREVLLQITLPLVLGGLVLLGLAGLSAFVAQADLKSHLADAALIGLIVQGLFFSLVGLLLLGLSAYAVSRLLASLPYAFLRIQIFFLKVQLGIGKFDNRLAEPVLRAHASAARRRAFVRSLRQVFWTRTPPE